MQKTHSETFIVKATECDKFRRMRLDALFISMQEVGERHAIELGAGYDAMMRRGLFFVLSRVHVNVTRAPRCGERVVHTTFPGVNNRFFCPRYHIFTLEDGTPLMTAGALWAILDFENRKIVSPLAVNLGFPDTSDLPAPIDLPVRLPALRPENAQTRSRTPVYSEFDINGHVNNTKYIAWMCDCLSNEALEGMYIEDLVAGYEKEIRDEVPFTLALARDGDAFSFSVLSEDGKKHFAAGGRLHREE